jgi:hypothetical protein
MSECWELDPEERPKMGSLLHQLQSLQAQLDLYV